MTEVIRHDPSARLDYTWRWSEWLSDGETITGFTVTAPPELTVEDPTTDGTTVTAWVRAAGAPARIYRVVCHVVTTAGREDDRSLMIQVSER